MNNFISKLLHRDRTEPPAGEIDREYISEYAHFMNHFLDEHPEALIDQHDGRLLYWDKKVDLVAQKKAEQDHATDDGYGFYSSAWRATKH